MFYLFGIVRLFRELTVFFTVIREQTKIKNKRNLTYYTDAVSFVTASVSMRLHLWFTRRRSSSLSEPERFENAFKSGAVSLVV